LHASVLRLLACPAVYAVASSMMSACGCSHAGIIRRPLRCGRLGNALDASSTWVEMDVCARDQRGAVGRIEADGGGAGGARRGERRRTCESILSRPGDSTSTLPRRAQVAGRGSGGARVVSDGGGGGGGARGAGSIAARGRRAHRKKVPWRRTAIWRESGKKCRTSLPTHASRAVPSNLRDETSCKQHRMDQSILCDLDKGNQNMLTCTTESCIAELSQLPASHPLASFAIGRWKG
jgi:hypothetical protein